MANVKTISTNSSEEMIEIEKLRQQVKMLEVQILEEHEHSYRANLRDVELCQQAQAATKRLRDALVSICKAMTGECSQSRLLTAGDPCFHEAARALWPDA